MNISNLFVTEIIILLKCFYRAALDNFVFGKCEKYSRLGKKISWLRCFCLFSSSNCATPLFPPLLLYRNTQELLFLCESRSHWQYFFYKFRTYVIYIQVLNGKLNKDIKIIRTVWNIRKVSFTVTLFTINFYLIRLRKEGVWCDLLLLLILLFLCFTNISLKKLLMCLRY